jgi:type I restriction enzyme S subunit
MKDLPSGWVETTLGNVCTKPQYGWTTRADPEGHGLRLLRTTDITPGVIDWDRVPFCSQAPTDVDKYLLAADDIVVSRAGSVGVSLRISSQPPTAVFASYLIRFRTLPGTEPPYLSWYLKSPAYWRQVAESAAGIALQNINAKKLAALAMPLPPTNEQQRIVAAIEEHFSRLDAADESLRRARQKLNILRTRTVEAAFAGDWPWTTLGETAEIVGGITKDAKRQSDPSFIEVPFLRVANVQRGFLDLTEVATIRVPPDKAKALELRAGDVLFNEGGDRDKLGRGWVWSGEIERCIHQNHVFRARLRDGFEPKFVSWHGNTFGRRWFEEHGRQTTNLASLNLTTLKSFPVPAPPVEEQRRVVSEIERQLSIADAMATEIDQALRRSAALRRAILGQAFSGKLVPQDASDEPAAALLERMGAERAAAPKPSRRKRKIRA